MIEGSTLQQKITITVSREEWDELAWQEKDGFVDLEAISDFLDKHGITVKVLGGK